MIIRWFKEFQDMGMQGAAMLKPWLRTTSLKKRGVVVIIGLESGLSEHTRVKS